MDEATQTEVTGPQFVDFKAKEFSWKLFCKRVFTCFCCRSQREKPPRKQMIEPEDSITEQALAPSQASGSDSETVRKICEDARDASLKISKDSPSIQRIKAD